MSPTINPINLTLIAKIYVAILNIVVIVKVRKIDCKYGIWSGMII